MSSTGMQMQIEQRAEEWLEGRLGKGEKIRAVAAGSYPTLVRGKSIWIAAVSAALGGTALEALGVPSPLGLASALAVAVTGWYVWLLRRDEVRHQPAAPWPLVVATNRRVLFLNRKLLGGGDFGLAVERRALTGFEVVSQSRETYRTRFSFRDGLVVDAELRRATHLVDELSRR
jgi:hypothetical protein